jgi:hypothetical protein
LNGEPPIYVYVLEDTRPRRFARVAGPNMYSVYEASEVRDGSAYDLNMVCGRLVTRSVKYFASYPEVRPFLIEQWALKPKQNSPTTTLRSKGPLGKAIAEAELKYGPAQMPETVVFRSVLDARFGSGGD